MEGGAKGQVGGMDMGEGERRRLAEESKGWKCNGCGGRSNEEILTAQEEEGGNGQNTSKAEVPEELRFGFKDEMPKEMQAEPSQTTRPADQSERVTSTKATSAATISTIPDPNPQSLANLNHPSATSTHVQSSTHNDLRATTLQAHIRTPTVPRASPQETVPAWIDKAIVGVVFALLIMTIRKFAA